MAAASPAWSVTGVTLSSKSIASSLLLPRRYGTLAVLLFWKSERGWSVRKSPSTTAEKISASPEDVSSSWVPSKASVVSPRKHASESAADASPVPTSMSAPPLRRSRFAVAGRRPGASHLRGHPERERLRLCEGRLARRTAPALADRALEEGG